MAKKSIPARCLAMSGLFEAELLTELMLRYWKHPFAEDVPFRQQLLETAAEVLKASNRGEKFLEDVPPAEMNLVAALWYAEWNSAAESTGGPAAQRQAWLDSVRKAVPSCFCSQNHLE
ncbi:MAG TPA: hypothetical protein VGY66_07950 [Gemmataceae bacterium]|nr:hypothetical protein [Gemmataceae bacterium]